MRVHPRRSVEPSLDTEESRTHRKRSKADAYEVGAEITPSRKLGRAMAKALDRAVEKNGGCGGAVLRISRAGTVLFEGTSGYAERARNVGRKKGLHPMSAETRFDIASITKTFTAAAILELVESGKLTLDTSLGELGSLARGFEPTITVRQLLDHTSGLADYWDAPSFIQAFTRDPERRWTPPELLAHAVKMKRIAAPGRRHHYSDTNYVLLGSILEHLEGAPLERIFRDRLLEPLGLNDTFLSHGEREGTDQSHRFEGKEDLFGKPRQSADWAGGGLVSTTRDLETFFLSLRANADWFRADRTPTSTKGVAYGLGMFEIELGNGRGSLWGHDGHGNSFAYYWPERDVMFTGTLNQTEGDWWPLVAKAIDLI